MSEEGKERKAATLTYNYRVQDESGQVIKGELTSKTFDMILDQLYRKYLHFRVLYCQFSHASDDEGRRL